MFPLPTSVTGLALHAAFVTSKLLTAALFVVMPMLSLVARKAGEHASERGDTTTGAKVRLMSHVTAIRLIRERERARASERARRSPTTLQGNPESGREPGTQERR